jgi:ABC-2 type transport system permease protein/lipopolysaccharide transport system permease protein
MPSAPQAVIYNLSVPSNHKLVEYDSSARPFKIFEILKSFWDQRQLIMFITNGYLKSKYQRSFLGIIWALLNPILSSLVLWVIFVSIFRTKLSTGTQFAPYVLAGVLTITFFNQGLLQTADSIANGSRLFLKIRFDPQILAIATTFVNAVNFILGLVALLFVSIISGAALSVEVPLVLIVGISLTMFTLGTGLILSLLLIRFDDIKYMVAITLQMLAYLTPVFYPKEILNRNVQILVSMNPLTSFLDVFRHLVNETQTATTFDWVYMLSSSTTVFFLGLVAFRKYWTGTVVML